MDMSWLSDPTALVALATLILTEVVLGVDNLIFISILTNKLPAHQQAKAHRIGISLALILRLAQRHRSRVMKCRYRCSPAVALNETG